jgi:hypothetical protein
MFCIECMPPLGVFWPFWISVLVWPFANVQCNEVRELPAHGGAFGLERLGSDNVVI